MKKELVKRLPQTAVYTLRRAFAAILQACVKAAVVSNYHICEKN
jgi:hypothetical protein